MQDAYAAYGMEHPDFILLKEKDRQIDRLLKIVEKNA